MKKIILALIILSAFSVLVYAEDTQIDPVLSNAMQSGIACESYLDGKFNNSISSLYFDRGMASNNTRGASHTFISAI